MAHGQFALCRYATIPLWNEYDHGVNEWIQYRLTYAMDVILHIAINNNA